jgi:hypothetical protein
MDIRFSNQQNLDGSILEISAEVKKKKALNQMQTGGQVKG